MGIALYFIAGYLALNVLLVIGQIGKERKPITPSVAVVAVVIYGAIVTILVAAGISLA